MNVTSQKVPLIEKIGYSLGDLAANLVFQTLITYLAYFYTDIYGLKNNDASIIMLVVGLVAAFLFNPIIVGNRGSSHPFTKFLFTNSKSILLLITVNVRFNLANSIC